MLPVVRLWVLPVGAAFRVLPVLLVGSATHAGIRSAGLFWAGGFWPPWAGAAMATAWGR